MFIPHLSINLDIITVHKLNISIIMVTYISIISIPNVLISSLRNISSRNNNTRRPVRYFITFFIVIIRSIASKQAAYVEGLLA